MSVFKSIAVLSLAVSSAYGHAFINGVQGANGISGLGLGVTFNGEVARGGTTEQPFQLDTPVMKNQKDDPCGATLLAGSVDISTAIETVSTAFGGLPTIPTSGKLTLGMFQVNADGGGPFTAEINTDATGKSWTAINVLSQPPGVNGIIHSAPANSTITVEIPSGTTCTGANGACVIRFNNGGPDSGSLANGAGPFGGCVAVAQTGATAGTGAAATTTAKTATSTKKAGKGNKAAAAAAGQRNAKVYGRHFYPTVKAREEAIAELERRQKLTAQLIDEIKTATGTAIDIPIDAVAGHDDAALLGGNSTTPTNAPLSAQNAVDLKKAVQLAIEQALGLLASDEVDAGANGQAEAVTDKANADAAAAIADGQLTSINAGNAGVGFFQTAVVDSLLGGLVTATNDLTATAAATATAAGGNNAAAASATTAAATGRKGKGGKGRFAAAAAATSRPKMMKRRLE
ncbi:uncharacterized protein TRAVEDRAFT_123691 [Trametes versicolor FP-101664 SS1]|uniref:uncharacterized protein n=1 Tax=Trametes versicolor (strain FP-101664) TaxID=717944 RepID=UPI000462189F|nr:uncharacterized protein TRAVEDRAFT_123691 [Trametes versicolor FP-101664 SS1]EIW58129.1 hypothetical protein TRAVEDRAFT_123691 [Trametes versicolor FP-101664 SS1]